ncbi:MAG: hypothetical protein WCO58_01060 [bacterium]
MEAIITRIYAENCGSYRFVQHSDGFSLFLNKESTEESVYEFWNCIFSLNKDPFYLTVWINKSFALNVICLPLESSDELMFVLPIDAHSYENMFNFCSENFKLIPPIDKYMNIVNNELDQLKRIDQSNFEYFDIWLSVKFKNIYRIRMHEDETPEEDY